NVAGDGGPALGAHAAVDFGNAPQHRKNEGGRELEGRAAGIARRYRDGDAALRRAGDIEMHRRAAGLRDELQRRGERELLFAEARALAHQQDGVNARERGFEVGIAVKFFAINMNFGPLREHCVRFGALGEPFVVVENGDAVTLGWFFRQGNLRKRKWERETKEFYAKRDGNDKSWLLNHERIA